MIDPFPWQLGVLGPVALRPVGRAGSGIGSPARRGLLALLALRRGSPVPVDEIVDVLWPEPPRTCRDLVHGHIAAARRLLRSVGAVTIRRAGGGYLLDAPTEAVDLLHFEALLTRAAGAPDADAIDLLAAALRLWRGRPVADAGSALRTHPDTVGVTHRRITAALRFADLATAAGRAAEAITAVQPLLAEEPLHEGLAARLVTARAAAGQQAAALEVYARVRARLTGELGVEPGPGLRAAQLAVLRQVH